MGVFSFLKTLFRGEEDDEKVLEEARARHGIQLSAKDKIEMNQAASEEDRIADEYDAWDELKHFRSTFFMGNWAAKKFKIIGEDKVKRELEELEKKREEEAKKKEQQN